MTFELKIELGNDAMRTPADVIAAVTRAVGSIDGADVFAPFAGGERGGLRDANGNTVGEWVVAP